MESEPNTESESLSKTQLKQEATDLQLLGQKLTSYDTNVLRKLPVTEMLISAIAEFNRLPNSHRARRRQLQFIGKLMRDLDYTALSQAISDLGSGHLKKKGKASIVSTWCDRILQSGDSEINFILESHPQLERQILRQLYREYNLAKASSKNKFKIKLQHYLKEQLTD